jgi:hypothetical protein
MTKLCECGCGFAPNTGKRFLPGHNKAAGPAGNTIKPAGMTYARAFEIALAADALSKSKPKRPRPERRRPPVEVFEEGTVTILKANNTTRVNSGRRNGSRVPKEIHDRIRAMNVQGLSIAEIAIRAGVSSRTVIRHRAALVSQITHSPLQEEAS